MDGGRRKTPSAWELGVEGVGEIVGLGDAGFDVHLAPRTEAGGLLEGAGNASRLGCLVSKYCKHKLPGLEGLQDPCDDVMIGLLGDVRFKADVREVGFRCNVDGHVGAIFSYSIHGVATRIE